MIAFIDDHRRVYGVEPICRQLPIAPSTYYARVAARHDPAKASARARADRHLRAEIRRVFETNLRVYGARKIWRQLRREGVGVARCTIERLMREMGLQGVVRGKPVKTTVSDRAAPCPLDRVNRQFQPARPNALWVADFTYFSTWGGFVYVAFVIDAFARRIVGWHVSRTPHAGFVLDALEQALHDRRPAHGVCAAANQIQPQSIKLSRPWTLVPLTMDRAKVCPWRLTNFGSRPRALHSGLSASLWPARPASRKSPVRRRR